MKRVTVTTELYFDVPDDSDGSNVTVEFPNGSPAIHASLDERPIRGASFVGHMTQFSSAEDENKDFSDDE